VKSDNRSFDAAIRAHDEAIAAWGLDVWIGAEPAFTNRRSESPEWLTDPPAHPPKKDCRGHILRLSISPQRMKFAECG
jgi:hypothetical protein